MRRFLLIISVAIFLVGGTWYLLVKRTEKQQNSQTNQGFLSFLSPKNNTGTESTGEDVVQNSVPDNTDNVEGSSPLQQLTKSPVAGVTYFSTEKTVLIPSENPKGKPVKQTVIERYLRYVLRSNGYVYEIKDRGTPIQISNIYIPNIYEAYFADNNKTVLLRFLRDDEQTVATYSVPIPELNKDNTRTQKAGVYFPDNIYSLAVSPDTSAVGRLVFQGGASLLTTTDSKNGGQKNVFSNPFRGWIVLWPQQNTLYLQTKASATARGFLYKVAGNRLQKVIGDVFGLTASVSPTGKYVLYSESISGKFITKLLYTASGVVKQLPVSVLPEKCVWLKSEDLVCAGSSTVFESTYPDDWYMGVVSFSDTLYTVFSSAGTIDTILGSSTDLDITNLTVNEEQRLLYFIDKKTGYLWQFQY